MSEQPRKVRDEAKVGNLLERKFAVSAKIQALRAEIAEINTEMVRVGATTDEIACL
ncbi:MAG: hypothetical protein H6712_33360 [Myxococcales bacterium]|nr:hypothetical protein [Myxococcales bacterium]